jgi:hypothetical protein
VILHLIANAPVISASAFSLMVIWSLPPQEVTNRWFMVFTLAVSYIVNVCLTAWLRRKFSDAAHMWFTFIRNIIMGSGDLVAIILSSVGAFNTCGGWAPLGSTRYVALIQNKFEDNVKKLYPGLFAGCVFSQITIFGLICVVQWRGLRLPWWPSILSIESTISFHSLVSWIQRLALLSDKWSWAEHGAEAC